MASLGRMVAVRSAISRSSERPARMRDSVPRSAVRRLTGCTGSRCWNALDRTAQPACRKQSGPGTRMTGSPAFEACGRDVERASQGAKVSCETQARHVGNGRTGAARAQTPGARIRRDHDGAGLRGRRRDSFRSRPGKSGRAYSSCISRDRRKPFAVAMSASSRFNGGQSRMMVWMACASVTPWRPPTGSGPPSEPRLNTSTLDL